MTSAQWVILHMHKHEDISAENSPEFPEHSRSRERIAAIVFPSFLCCWRREELLRFWRKYFLRLTRTRRGFKREIMISHKIQLWKFSHTHQTWSVWYFCLFSSVRDDFPFFHGVYCASDTPKSVAGYVKRFISLRNLVTNFDWHFSSAPSCKFSFSCDKERK